MLLYPGVDSLNHNPLTKNRWFSDEKVFGIVVEDEVTAGMEIWNPYGGKGNGECEFNFLPNGIRLVEERREDVCMGKRGLISASTAVIWLLSRGQPVRLVRHEVSTAVVGAAEPGARRYCP